jgi:hypothetical protein
MRNNILQIENQNSGQEMHLGKNLPTSVLHTQLSNCCLYLPSIRIPGGQPRFPHFPALQV